MARVFPLLFGLVWGFAGCSHAPPVEATQEDDAKGGIGSDDNADARSGGNGGSATEGGASGAGSSVGGQAGKTQADVGAPDAGTSGDVRLSGADQPRAPRAADEDYNSKALSQLRFPPATSSEIAEVQNNLDRLFSPKSFKGSTGLTLPYRLHTPDRAAYKNKVPLILFMHGAGERGADNKAQVGPTVFIAGPGVLAIGARAKAMPAFILAPQCPWAPEHWDGTNVTPTDLRFSGSTKSLTTTMELLDAVIKENPTIDTRRIYVMGMSMGGFATWEMISRWPEKFAAAMPMCSGGDRSMASKIVYMPIWAFHSTDDGNVPIEWDRRMIDKLKSLGGTPKFNTYTGPGHIVWGPAYREPDLFPWLFSQSQ